MSTTAMRTLFSQHILSPPPRPCPPSPPRPPPLNLVFHSSVTSSSNASFASSPTQNDWLTPLSQHHSSDGGDVGDSYGHEPPAIRRRGSPSVAFMGARRCGKSSIRKVVYEKFSPADTLYLEPTTKVETAQMSGFIHIHGCEIPGDLPITSADFDHAAILGAVGAVVWVIDCQDEYFTSIRQLLELAVFLGVHYPQIALAVFVHKSDGLTDEYKYEAFREIRQRVQDELADAGFGDRAVAYYQTSIFDHSIFEAMSKMVQKLLPQVPALEALLNRLSSACRIQKAYLFDTTAKIYIATDASPTFLKDYEVCSEYVDMVVDLKQIYGWRSPRPPSQPPRAPASSERADAPRGCGGPIAESVISYDRSGDTYMYAREITDFLSVVCILGRGSSTDKRTLIDYNASIIQEALIKIFDV